MVWNGKCWYYSLWNLPDFLSVDEDVYFSNSFLSGVSQASLFSQDTHFYFCLLVILRHKVNINYFLWQQILFRALLGMQIPVGGCLRWDHWSLVLSMVRCLLNHLLCAQTPGKVQSFFSLFATVFPRLSTCLMNIFILCMCACACVCSGMHALGSICI